MYSQYGKLKRSRDYRTLNNTVLLVCVFILIFVIPVFPTSSHRLLFNLFLTIIFLAAMLAMDKHRKIFLVAALINIGMEWVSTALEIDLLTGISNALNILFFSIVVISLIVQIARTRKATIRIIMQAVNGYLLLGIVFGLLVAVSMLLEPGSFSFGFETIEIGTRGIHIGDYLYYAFVNYTTLGYGDITPQLPFAKSLAILMSVSGQIYLAVIIAMLVGKYVGSMGSGAE